MRISDWSSDVCSADLHNPRHCERRSGAAIQSSVNRPGLLRFARNDDVQTILCDASQFHSSSGQIATGSPALFINPKPCPPRPKKCASTGAPIRSEERRGGNECVSRCRSRRRTSHEKKQQKNTTIINT